MDDIPENSNEKTTKKKCCKIRLTQLIYILDLIMLTLCLIEVLIVFYFTFAGIVFLTIYLIFYEWLAVLTKNPLHMVLSILSILSDFGLFYILALMCIYLVKSFEDIVIRFFQNFKESFINLTSNFDSYYETTTKEQRKKDRCKQFIVYLTYFITFGIGALLIYYILEYLAAVLEIAILLLFAITDYLVVITNCCNKLEKKMYPSYGENSLDNVNNVGLESVENDENNKPEDIIEDNESSNDENINEPLQIINLETYYIDNNILQEDKGNSELADSCKECCGPIYQLIVYFGATDIIQLSEIEGMFSNDVKIEKCEKFTFFYKMIISVIIYIFQFYPIVNAFLNNKITIGYLFLFIFIRLFLMIKILKFNILNLIIKMKSTFKTFTETKIKIVFWIIFVLNILAFLGFLILLIYSRSNFFTPSVDKAIYYDRDRMTWYKLKNNQYVKPEGFCYTQAQKDGTYKTDDFAFMATLPRLYDINENGDCYIKPSKRGLFNTTMKTIFGKNYENDNITIHCKKVYHYPYLIISSKKILKQTHSYFGDYTILTDHIVDENHDYFLEDEHFKPNELPDNLKELYNNYQDCAVNHSFNYCSEKWDIFTQFYWPTMYNDSYVNISGFERYQDTIHDIHILTPSFMSKDGVLWDGTHYIVGGSYEDNWGIGYYIETFGRKYIAEVLDTILPFYSLIRSFYNDVFLFIEYINRYLFYLDVSSENQLRELQKLYNQFNFTEKALFSIGHSISGTAIKGIGFTNDIQGIVFEASDGESNANLNFFNKKNKISGAETLITNVYSDDTIFTGIDENCITNGVLPKRYKLPNVYDTACLVAITCSETRKYEPLCYQVLNQNDADPSEEFQKSVDAFLEHYGYN